MSYFEEYDNYVEPSEVDALIAEAVSEVETILKDEVKSELDRIKAQIRLGNEVDKTIREKQNELKRLTQEIERETKKYESITVGDTLQKAVLTRILNAATTGLVPGQKVWYLNQLSTRVDCPTCNKKGEVEVDLCGRPIIINCPTCSGRGYMYNYAWEIKSSEVRRVDLKLCFTRDHINYWTRDRVVLIDNKDFAYDSHQLVEVFISLEAAEKYLATKLSEVKTPC